MMTPWRSGRYDALRDYVFLRIATGGSRKARSMRCAPMTDLLSTILPGLMTAAGVAAVGVMTVIVGRSGVVVRATKKADELESKALRASDDLVEKLTARIDLLERERSEDRAKIAALEARIHQLEADLELERKRYWEARLRGADDAR
jgi:hypothetical protein